MERKYKIKKEKYERGEVIRFQVSCQFKKMYQSEDYLGFESCQYFIEQIDKLTIGLRSEKNMTPYDIEISLPEHDNVD